jgi:anti-sigma factor RsiW
MDNECDKIRDKIADFVTGVLPEADRNGLEQHFSECSACREYCHSLQQEDQLLAELFANFDSAMTSQENEVINAVNLLAACGRGNVISEGGMIVRSAVARLATTAAVLGFLAVYFIITLVWIYQIRECIQRCTL